MNIEQFLTDKVAAAVRHPLRNAGAPLQIQKTRKEFEGDYTLVVFPLLKASRKSPEATATETGEYLGQYAGNQGVQRNQGIPESLARQCILGRTLPGGRGKRHLRAGRTDGPYRNDRIPRPTPTSPFHLGHIRNNLLGYSVAQILKANGNKVIKVNPRERPRYSHLQVDAGLKLYGGGETPASVGDERRPPGR